MQTLAIIFVILGVVYIVSPLGDNYKKKEN